MRLIDFTASSSYSKIFRKNLENRIHSCLEIRKRKHDWSHTGNSWSLRSISPLSSPLFGERFSCRHIRGAIKCSTKLQWRHRKSKTREMPQRSLSSATKTSKLLETVETSSSSNSNWRHLTVFLRPHEPKPLHFHAQPWKNQAFRTKGIHSDRCGV